MGRRHGEEGTRRNRTRQYPGGYDRPGDQHRGPPESGFFGPYYDSRGNRFHEDQYGSRYYDEDHPEPYGRDYDERYRDERERGRSTSRTAIMWAGIVAVALIVVVGMVMATDDFTSGPSDSAQQAPQQQQPVEPQQPAQQQPQAPAAPQQPDGASAEQVEGVRADLERQLAEIRQSINQLRLEIWSFFTSQSNQQQEEPAQ